MNYKPVSSKWEAPCAHYLYNALFNSEAGLNIAAHRILQGFYDGPADTHEKFEFDTIVCCGISGIVFGLPLARKMGRKIVIVRKDGDGTHSTNRVESDCFANEVGNYIIVDDLIDSGATLERILKEMKEHSGKKGKHVATYLYAGGNLRRPPEAEKKRSSKLNTRKNLA